MILEGDVATFNAQNDLDLRLSNTFFRQQQLMSKIFEMKLERGKIFYSYLGVIFTTGVVKLQHAVNFTEAVVRLTLTFLAFLKEFHPFI